MEIFSECTIVSRRFQSPACGHDGNLKSPDCNRLAAQVLFDRSEGCTPQNPAHLALAAGDPKIVNRSLDCGQRQSRLRGIDFPGMQIEHGGSAGRVLLPDLPDDETRWEKPQIDREKLRAQANARDRNFDDARLPARPARCVDTIKEIWDSVKKSPPDEDARLIGEPKFLQGLVIPRQNLAGHGE